MSGSGQTAAPRMQEQRNMAELRAFLQEGLRSEQVLQRRLQALKEAHRQQLQETVRRQREGLEKRIHLNSMLSVDVGDRSSADRQLEELFSCQARPKRSSSMSDLSSGMETASRTSPLQVRQSDKPVRSSTAWACATTVPQRANGTPKTSPKAPPWPQLLGLAEKEPVRLSKEEEAEAECQRKFRAVPVPGHVFLPLYHDMMQVRELERKNSHEQRRDFLLSMQKPFSFLERDEKKREKLIQMLSVTVAQETQKTKVVRKPIPKAIKDPAVSEHLKEEELCRKIRIQLRAQKTLRNSTAPVDNQTTHPDHPEPRTAQRTRREILAFLDEKPTFQPKTNAQVPDFDRLYQAFQRDALRRAERKEATRCQPFCLRTSTLPTRQSRASSAKAKEPTVNAPLRRSKSLGGLASLSTDTLPTYITDATRKRCVAIRKSVAQRESREQEGAEWMRRSRMRSQSMQKTVAVRAKVMDPHSSLKEVYQEKLKLHREADQQRMRDYKRELQDMKARVTVRPYLFEQVTQKTAKAEAERVYRNKLKEAGLNERFVETKGENIGVTTGSISGEEEEDDGGGGDDDDDDQSTENTADIQKREGTVDDGEKIEEVEEESVKTKVEKMQ